MKERGRAEERLGEGHRGESFWCGVVLDGQPWLWTAFAWGEVDVLWKGGNWERLRW